MAHFNVSPEEKYQNIIKKLDERRLDEAIVDLHNLAPAVMNDEMLFATINSMDDTYQTMLYYAHKDAPDPERYKIFNNILSQAYSIADSIHDYMNADSSSVFYKTRSEILSRNDRSIENYQMILETYEQDNAVLKLLNEHEKLVEGMTRHELTQNELFNRVWTSDSWKEEQLSQAAAFMDSTLISEQDKAFFISALTLNQLHSPEDNKLLFILQQTKREEDIIKMRAAVGFALVCCMFKNRVTAFQKVSLYLSLLEPNDKGMLFRHLLEVQKVFTNSLETEKISRIIAQDIIPGLVRASFKKTDDGTGYTFVKEEDFYNEDKNPEWTELKRKGIEDSLNKMSEWQMEGKDTNYVTFRNFMDNPFYEKVCNWFRPFDIDSTYADMVLENTDDKSFMTIFLTSNILLCDVDKFSVCLLFNSTSKAITQVLLDNFKSKEEDIRNMVNDNENDFTLSSQYNLRNYLQDLYRFFNEFRQRDNFSNPFKTSLVLSDCMLLKPLFTSSPEKGIETANMYLNADLLEEAHALYLEFVPLVEGKAEIFQKVGYTCQQLKHYKEAVGWYLRADFAKPDNAWTTRHIAQCYRLNGEYAQAEKYYSRAEPMFPDNESLLLALAECYLKMNDYDNALKRLFEAEFKFPNSIKVARALAWATFLARKYERSFNLYEKILGKNFGQEKITTQDYLNAGHCSWLYGNKLKAIDYYIKSIFDSQTEEGFMDQFKEDEHFLMERGISLQDIVIMKEVIRRFVDSHFDSKD